MCVCLEHMHLKLLMISKCLCNDMHVFYLLLESVCFVILRFACCSFSQHHVRLPVHMSFICLGQFICGGVSFAQLCHCIVLAFCLAVSVCQFVPILFFFSA